MPLRMKRLTLRQKFFVSLLFFVLSISVVGTLSYADLVSMGERVDTIAAIDKLGSALLEIRRYEKNYLLYRNPEDLQLAHQFYDESMALLDEFVAERTARSESFAQLRQSLVHYGTLMQQLDGTITDEVRSSTALEQLRHYGKEMVDRAEQLSGREQNRIDAQLSFLKLQLVGSVVLALALGVLGAYLLFGKLFNAIRIIYDATESVAQGRFKPLPVVDSRDETRRIIRAFNRMVQELERRQDQLVQAQKLSSIGTLAAGIAHQLNNPLNNISTSSQLAVEELGEGDREFIGRMLHNIEGEADRAKEIVQGLLEFSRERSFQPTTASVSRLVARTVRLISSQVPAGIEVVQDVPEDLFMRLDVQKIQEALLNLVFNAVQAIPDTGGRVTIAARPGSGGWGSISVEDTGVGIPKDQLPRIFDPFYTTKEERVGTGLGLSIVYGIVEKHGGRIEVTSQEGKGTIFKVLLPMAEPEAKPVIEEGKGHAHA